MKRNTLLSKTTSLTMNSTEFDQYQIAYFVLPYKETGRICEDSLLIKKYKDLMTFAICDGAGGHKDGAGVSELIVKQLYSYSSKSYKLWNSPLSCIETINEDIKVNMKGSKSTLIVGTIKNNYLRFHSVGDSEILVFNKICELKYNNIPDSVSSYRVEAGIVNQEKSLDDKDRHFVTNLMGDDVIRIESQSSMKIMKGDNIIIGSDGLFDNISHEYLREIYFNNSFKEAFERMSKLCVDQEYSEWKKADDISFMMINRIS